MSLNPLVAVPSAAEQRPLASERAVNAIESFQVALEAQLRTDSAGLVRATRTPLSGGQAASALEQAYQTVTGKAISPRALTLLTAQWAHETGGGRSMLNYNFGGIKGSSPAGLSAAYKTHEGSGTQTRQIIDKFSAYRTAEEGALDYVRLLERRYPQALEAAEHGDTQGFVGALKAGGYFTGDQHAYTLAVHRLSARAGSDGFDAIGGPAGDGEPLDAPRVLPEVLPGQLARGPSVQSRPTGVQDFTGAEDGVYVDVRAITDELSRAAIRIATSNEREERRS